MFKLILKRSFVDGLKGFNPELVEGLPYLARLKPYIFLHWFDTLREFKSSLVA